MLTSCAKTENKDYKADVSVDDISTKICEKVSLNTLIKADKEWIAFNIPIDTSSCEEFTVYISANGESNLFGVFKANSEKTAETLHKQTQTYLENMENNWMSEYLPEELPKIQNAVTERCGLYVCFIILDDDLRNDAKNVFTEMLTK